MDAALTALTAYSIQSSRMGGELLCIKTADTHDWVGVEHENGQKDVLKMIDEDEVDERFSVYAYYSDVSIDGNTFRAEREPLEGTLDFIISALEQSANICAAL